jgi:hypothetical protein
MLGTPLDGLVLWAGLAVASLVSLGVAVGLPGVTAPDASGLAGAIDRVAASPYHPSTTVPVAADAIRLDTGRLSLRRAGRTSHASFALGPVTPVGDGAGSPERLGSRRLRLAGGVRPRSRPVSGPTDRVAARPRSAPHPPRLVG